MQSSDESALPGDSVAENFLPEIRVFASMLAFRTAQRRYS
jgi:hypothetical protein